MGRKVGIIAYGTIEDRQRLEALARSRHMSASHWLIDQIRIAHDQLFGPADESETESEADRGNQEAD